MNNAGILRDKAFANMPLDDFRLVLDVHMMGATNCTRAVWNHMRAQRHGRIVMTTSSPGLYGNFGQATPRELAMSPADWLNSIAGMSRGDGAVRQGPRSR